MIHSLHKFKVIKAVGFIDLPLLLYPPHDSDQSIKFQGQKESLMTIIFKTWKWFNIDDKITRITKGSTRGL